MNCYLKLYHFANLIISLNSSKLIYLLSSVSASLIIYSAKVSEISSFSYFITKTSSSFVK